MLDQIKEFYSSQDKLIFFMILFTVTTILVEGILFGVYQSFLPPQIPLFYSQPWGDAQLATKLQFLVLPCLTLLMLLINIIIANQLHNSQKILKRILAISSAFSALLILITYVQIILIFN